MNLTRIRVGCSITALIGVMYAAVGLFDSLTHVAVGAIIASAGVIGYGLADWLDMRREEETRRGRAATWARRDAEAAGHYTNRKCPICAGLWSPFPCPYDGAHHRNEVA